ATPKAKILIGAIGSEILASPEMTAKWEQRLKDISNGEASPKQFMELTNKMVSHIIEASVKNAGEWAFNEEDKEGFTPGKSKQKKATAIGKCKFCEGKVIDKGKFYGCTNFNKTKCNFTISKKIMGKSITQKLLKQLLQEGATELMDGFKSKEKTFSAKLMWDDKEKRVKFMFQNQ
ncbi:topoisomerase C-terminal repeat-containing protein, partial [Bacillus sp. JJ1503]